MGRAERGERGEAGTRRRKKKKRGKGEEEEERKQRRRKKEENVINRKGEKKGFPWLANPKHCQPFSRGSLGHPDLPSFFGSKETL